jgi:outer membrane protein OmpA-like peptidoglycan-associated protein
MLHSLRFIASSLLLGLCCTHAAAQSPVQELHPLLPYIFFDSASAAVPDRYALFHSPQEASSFNEADLPSNSLDIHHRLLDIIGSRMQHFSETRIEIVGCNSKQPEIGEVIEVSKKRGETVRDYLVRIWGIDSGRITMLPPRDLPQYRSNIKDPLGIVENRRVEIYTNNWEIIKPIITYRSTANPEPADSTRDIYNLILFKFDSPEMGPVNEKILKEYIVPGLRQGAQINVVGYTDVIGLDDRSYRPHCARASTVVNAIKKNTKPGIIASLTGNCVGRTETLHPNEIPEGRFHNRCVQVIVTTSVR